MFAVILFAACFNKGRFTNKKTSDSIPIVPRLANFEAIITNMNSCGILTEHIYHGNGNLLVGLWKITATFRHEVGKINPMNLASDLDSDRFDETNLKRYLRILK